MDKLINRQAELYESISKLKINFGKDSESRKTPEYLENRLEKLENIWVEFHKNHTALGQYQTAHETQDYFSKDIYDTTMNIYHATRHMLLSAKQVMKQQHTTPASDPGPSTSKADKATIPCGPAEDFLSTQRTNFRELLRMIRGIEAEDLSELWELEGELRDLQLQWDEIKKQHLKIDNILQGTDPNYNEAFTSHEKAFKHAKRAINEKISSSSHAIKSTPTLEIPTFSGNCINWPTFFDLFTDAIHNNKELSKAQKMQHLKSKIRGEAERLVQHLNIAGENYDTAWDILKHRYQNHDKLFRKQMEVFLDQPKINNRTAFELKRLHDVSMETLHAVHNLGIDTTSWDPLITLLMSRKLDSVTYIEYRESRKNPRDLATVDEMFAFLEKKFTARESIGKQVLSPTQQARTPYNQPRTFNQNRSTEFYRSTSQYKPNYQPNYQKTYQAVATYTNKCPLCSHPHNLFQCYKFTNMAADAQLKTVSRLRLCINCLYKHYNKCTSEKRCKTCNGEHNTLLHDACVRPTTANVSLSTPVAKLYSAKTNDENKTHTVSHVASMNEEVLLTTILLNVKCNDGKIITLRALLDQGSQISLISESAAQTLGLPRKQYSASISGIGSGPKQSKGIVTIECQSIYGDYEFTTQALVLSKIINNLPNATFTKQSWPHLRFINLADPEYNLSKPIDLLLDANVYSDIIMNGLRKGPPEAPIAQQTKVGWVLSGSVKRTYNCNVVINELADISKYWELEDISFPSNVNNEDEMCEEFYQQTTKRLECGKYEVALPMKQNFENELGETKSKSLAQFRQLEQKLLKDQTLAQKYTTFIEEYYQLGHMRRANFTKQPTCYLPHHGVWKMDSSTTKLRVVFNASSKSSTQKSLNDLMLRGPNLQQDIHKLIINWRQYQFVMSADIEKMFRMIFIRERDQNLQTILWRNSQNEPISEYNLTTVTYGTKAAPYLAMRTLRQVAIDDGHKYPLAVDVLNKKLYTDDLFYGSNSLTEAKEVQHQLISILSGAGFNLRQWSSNCPQLLEGLSEDKVNPGAIDIKDTEPTKTLGLRWDPVTDSFTFKNVSFNQHNKGVYTKRNLLSDISKVFDPIGWLSPITIRAKLLFQKAWTTGLSWDDILPTEIQQEWAELRSDLQNITKFSIARHLGNTNDKYQLHCFCDSSEKIYACSIYIVIEQNKGECTSRLITAKTKLAPLNKAVTLPRLELCGALLLSQLLMKVKESLDYQNSQVFAWIDNRIVLCWIKGNISRWKPFVANRVQQITKNIPASQWNYVSSEENAADCATRGMTCDQLIKHKLWWEGPSWLKNFDSEKYTPPEYHSSTLEEKKLNVNAALCENKSSLINELLLSNSSITRVIKTIAWVLRFATRTRRILQSADLPNILSSTEIRNAFNLIIKHIQWNDFEIDIKNLKTKSKVASNSKLLPLNPYLDQNGLLRVGGRLNNCRINEMSKHPIILSNNSRLTELIIDQAHRQTLHGGPKLTLAHVRDKYWIIHGISSVKKQLRNCVTCRRFNQKNLQQIMADLPEPRVTPSRPYSHCAIDFTGHIELKINKGRGVKTSKGYVAVFVCLCTKAVHLELVSDLSTAAFLAAFKRMCARRGTPKEMYSDNGTNFIGASRLLREEYEIARQHINSAFINYTNEHEISWHFNAPAWPHAGGLWEAAVRCMKYHLKRVIGTQKLTYEELLTLLTQIEACMNSRPLCALSENTEDLEALTPGHFLTGGPLLSSPQSDTHRISLPTRWQLVQTMMKGFWKKWSHEYLQSLQKRSKWQSHRQDIKGDDIVVVKDEMLPPTRWALARVMEVHPGKDGHTRVVTLKTSSGMMKRPITKLCILPVHQPEMSPHPSNNTKPSEKQSKFHGRGKRSFKNFFIFTLFTFLSLFTLSIQQEQRATFYNVSTLRNNQSMLFFDKINDLQLIKDEWKLIMYYNISTYWHGISDIKLYVTHLREICSKDYNEYSNMISQLEHEVQEIEHYTSFISDRSKWREKRGLIDGVGYIANSLFGVLDERFAQQYEKDINNIAENENHLLNLLKNQTIVVETEYKILKRNEENMNKQFEFIKERLANITSEVNRVTLDNKNGLYITSSAFTASVIIANLRRIQESLTDTVTDISHGHISMQILPPEKLIEQIDLISHYIIHSDLTVPVNRDDILELYKLIKIFGRVMNNYLIIEVKIPLVSRDVYELDKVIGVPHRFDSNYSRQIIPKIPYIAYNLQKDMGILINEYDFRSCFQTTSKLLCPFNNIVYDLSSKKSYCNIQISSDITESTCESIQSPCREKWIKLHQLNSWLYSCCEECNVRIICGTAGVKMLVLSGNGLFTLEDGCTLKSGNININAHNYYVTKVIVEPQIPEISPLNTLLNQTLLSSNMKPTTNLQEYHKEEYAKIKEQLKLLKEQSNQSVLTVHDVHHYTVLYIIIGIVIVVGGGFICMKVKSNSCGRAAGVRAASGAPPEPQPRLGAPRQTTVFTEPGLSGSDSVVRSQSLLSVDKGTSPILSVRFNNIINDE